jgi:hypothetical protein
MRWIVRAVNVVPGLLQIVSMVGLYSAEAGDVRDPMLAGSGSWSTGSADAGQNYDGRLEDVNSAQGCEVFGDLMRYS